MRAPRTIVRNLAAVLLVAAAGVHLSASCTGDVAPDLSHDGVSYTAMAEQMLALRTIPALESRPPLYPLVLAVLMRVDEGSALARVVLLQRAAWVACGVLIFFILTTLRVRTLLAAAGALLFYVSPAPLLLVPLIYAEVFAMLATLGALLAFVHACEARPRRDLLAAALAALLAIAAAYLRPIFQLVPVVVGLLALADHRRSWRARCLLAAPFVAVVLVGLAPWYVWHARTRGGAFFVKTAGYSLVNYLGDRRLLGRFPPEHGEIEEAYRRRFAAKPDDLYVPWWEMQEDFVRLAERSSYDWDRLHLFMGRVALDVLAANPSYYLTRWRETWQAFATTVQPPPNRPGCLAWRCAPWWAAVRSSVGAWLPFLVLLVELMRWARGGAVSALAAIALYLIIGLANTAIEPWPGQERYRAPLEPLLLVAVLGAARGEGFVRSKRSARPRIRQAA